MEFKTKVKDSHGTYSTGNGVFTTPAATGTLLTIYAPFDGFYSCSATGDKVWLEAGQNHTFKIPADQKIITPTFTKAEEVEEDDYESAWVKKITVFVDDIKQGYQQLSREFSLENCYLPTNLNPKNLLKIVQGEDGFGDILKGMILVESFPWRSSWEEYLDYLAEPEEYYECEPDSDYMFFDYTKE